MKKRNYDELAVYCLEEEKRQVLIQEVRNLFIKKTTEVIYFVLNQRLYGIICLGDCLRMDNGYIKINTEFSQITNWDLMRAKHMFMENCKINKIPVVNEEHMLMGDYSRWDDELTTKHFISDDMKAVLLMHIKKKSRVYIVVGDIGQGEGFKSYSDGKSTQNINIYDVKNYCSEDAVFIFGSEDERRAAECYYGRRNPNFATWPQLYRNYIKRDIDELELTLSALRQEGLYICLLGNYHENAALQNACAMAMSKRLEEEENPWSAFLDDLYTESYGEKIASMQFVHTNMNGLRILQDTETEVLNVKEGIRKTYYVPDQYVGTIWFFGACLIVGAFAEDKNTIESHLQKRLVENGYAYRVVNCGAWENVNRVLMNFTQFKKGDVIIVYTDTKRYKDFLNISLEDFYVQKNIPMKWADGHLHHCNHKVNELIANEVFEKIVPNLILCNDMETQNSRVVYDIEAVKLKLATETYINIYFADFMKERYQKTGAIVMNCNPFTKGHLYLIERAAEQVDLLIIFVVQEDKSLFSFEERFEMVKEGVCDLSNVKVVPSGNFILSHMTFPEYFGKVKTDDLKTDIEYDLRLWGECIVPSLGINYRFVGEEKEDIVTDTYNTAMKKILSEYNVKVVEFSRMQDKGRNISASYVRELLEKHKFEDAFSMIPESSRKIIERQL